MHCFVYKSLCKADTYIYLRKQDGGTELPAALRNSLAPLQHVLELELTPKRNLAQADAARVIEALEQQGYYLQFPPNPPAGDADRA